MSNELIITNLLLFCCLALPAQSPCEGYRQVFMAEQLYRSGERLDEAVLLYRQALEYPLKNGSQVLDAISCATTLQDAPAATRFMTCGLGIGLQYNDYVRLWSHIGHDMNLDSLGSQIDTISAARLYMAALRPELIESLLQMAERDQKFRAQDAGDSPAQRHNDSLNWQELQQITLQLGHLPTCSELGFDGSEALEILFYHMDKAPLEWFLPYVVRNIQHYESNLGRIILYQLDRIGMSEGVIYDIQPDLTLRVSGPRTQMRNGMWCQAYGEWFDEQDMETNTVYATPIDPGLSVETIDRMRRLLCLDDLESRQKRKPWAKVVSLAEFEQVFRM